MTHESKQEINLHSEQSTATSIASLLTSTDCFHPELSVTDETEWNYLTQIGEALAKDEFDDAAYSQLFTRLEADNLSLAALYRFANLCYQHWQRQWPSASVLQTNQTEIERQAAQLHAMAQGRTLFRRSGTPTRYYWGRTNASENNATEKGLFFACYPTFAAQGESVKAIYQAELITDVAHIVLCEAHTQVQRRQQSFSQLLRHSSLLHQRLQQHGHHAKVIVNLQLAWLYYRSGYIVSSLSIHETGQAVFYFRQAMGQIARHAFTQQQPALPTTLITASEQVREMIDQAMLDQAQQTLFAAQSATLITRWQQCYQDAQLEAIYQLSQQTHALLTHATSVSVAAKQPLLDAWLAGFNRPVAGEDDQEVRVAMQSAVTRACNPAQKYPHSLATVHQWLLTLARQLQQHGEAARAKALLHAYQQLLILRRPNLQGTIAHTDQDTAPYIAVLAACEQALIELDQWFKTTHLVTETKESKQSAALTIKPSAFAQRNEQIQTWHQTLAQSLAANTKASDIYTANTEFARNLLAGICHEIEQQIGPAPCAYTLLGAGSFSRGEISPASDLDCALLVADASIKKVDEDNSSKVTFHPWFQCFLQLVQWKLASLPEGILSLESETLAWISKGYWFDTPAGLIEQHLVSQQPNNPMSRQQPENFGAQWLRWIYSSENQAQEKDALFRDYQQRLQTFFHTPIGTSSLPAYQQLAPWSLAQHVGQAVAPKPRTFSLTPTQASVAAQEAKETKETKENKHEVKASPSHVSTKITFTVLNVKNLSYRLTNAILCYGRFHGVPAGITTTREVLVYLKGRQFLPASFITRLETALEQLYTWRLRQHWAWLHHASELGENEVVLWPEDTAQQVAIRALPSEWRGFYLDKAETQQCQTTILNTIAEAIGRSVAGFATYATQLPISAIDDSPSSSSSVTTTTTITPDVKETKGTKEAKREVSEEEAQAILTSQLQVVAETKALAPSSAAKIFNPLATAVEWTLHQLADNKQSQATQTGHVTWLAHIMGSCATELPVSESHANDPTRVKQDPLLRRHWQIYWAIPTAWRDVYIQQLRQSLTTKIDVFIQLLTNAPNTMGWRLATQIGEQQWQQALRPLFATEPQSTLPDSAKTDIAQGKAVWVSWIDQNTIRWAPLRQKECADVLIDAKQQRWQPQHNVHGNHRLYALQTPSHSFWVKAYPEQPGTEYLVTALDRRLGVNGTPAQQLMALHHAPLRVPDGTPQGMRIEQSAILLSSHVADAKYTLHSRIKHEPQLLEKLDFIAFAKTLLRVLLTNPEDDKGSDYFLVPLAGSDKYQLIRIDNERAFLPVTHLTQSKRSSQEDLQVKSILYCLDQMLLPWDSDPRTAALLDDLRQIQPSALIIDLLKDIEQQHTHWQQLFSKTSTTQHACLQGPWMSVPTFMLPQGLESALLKRLTSLQTALRLLKPQAITGLKLLELVQPKLARYYNQSLFQGKLARNPKLPQANVQARFDQVAGRYYQPQRSAKSATTHNSDHQTSVASGPAVLSRQLSIALPELPKSEQEKDALINFVRSVWLQQAHSVQQALAAVATWQHLEAQRVRKGLLALRKEAQIEFSLLSAREQQVLLEHILPQETSVAMTLSLQQQEFLLQALVGAQCHDLNLTAFKAVLSNTHLETILKASGQQVIALDISGCSELTPVILKTIAQCCPHLRRLRMNFQRSWTKVTVGDFANLTILECEHATLLTHLRFGALPKLRRLSLVGATALRELANQGFGLTQNTASWRFPALQLLNVLGCEKLRAIKVRVDAPEQLKLLSLGCMQLTVSGIEPVLAGDILTDELALQFYPDGRMNNAIRTASGESALLLAAINGQLETLQWLLDHGASLAEKNNEGATALLWAASNGQLETVQWLLAPRARASLAEKDNKGNTALLWAADNGQLATVEWLLDHGASLTEKNNDGDSALLLAITNGQLATVEWLLDHGASPAEENNLGATALLWAAANGQLTIVQCLHARGASLAERTNSGDTALLLAAMNGHLPTVRWLLDHGASPAEENNLGATALLWAAANGQLTIVQCLHARGASLAEKNNLGATALLWAAANGQLTIVQWLFAHGASLVEKNNYGNTALLLAATNGHLETMQWLLDHGASLAERNNEGGSALLRAIANGHLETVQWLLAHRARASLAKKDNKGNTALLLAAGNGQLATLQWLLTHGASLTEKNNDGDSALLLAAGNGQLATLQWLLTHGASLTEKNNDGDSALLLAAMNGHLATVEWLLDHDASLAERNDNSDTALLLAAYNGKLETVQWLLTHGAPLAEKTNSGNTALLLAAMNGHLATVEWLLDHDASLAEKDNAGRTALLWAAYNGQLATVQWLLDHGASLAERTNNGNTALLLAAYNGHLETLQWLLDHDASLAERTNSGDTALLLAAMNGHLPTVQWLLAHDASLAEKDNFGDTALLWAANNGKLETVQWLLAHGASLTEKTNLGGTILLKAISSGSMEMLQFCLQKGMSLAEKNNEGAGAFLYAALGGQIDMMKWLLTQGFSLTDTDDNGMTALSYATKRGKLQAIQWLLAQGATWMKDKEGNTALMLAVKEAQLESVQWLVTEGKVALTEKNNVEKTALEVAIDLAQKPSDKVDTHRRIVHVLVAAYQAQSLTLPEVAIPWLAEPGNQPRDSEPTQSSLPLANKKEEVKGMPEISIPLVTTDSSLKEGLPAVTSIDSAPTLNSTTAPLSVPQKPLSVPQKPPVLPHERKVEIDVENPLPPSQPKTSLPAPHSQFFIAHSPADEKVQLLLDEVREALDRAYPPRMVEHHDARRAYLTQLAEYQSHSGNLNKAERDTLRQLLATLEEVVAQRRVAQPSATSTTTMQNQ